MPRELQYKRGTDEWVDIGFYEDSVTETDWRPPLSGIYRFRSRRTNPLGDLGPWTRATEPIVVNLDTYLPVDQLLAEAPPPPVLSGRNEAIQATWTELAGVAYQLEFKLAAAAWPTAENDKGWGDFTPATAPHLETMLTNGLAYVSRLRKWAGGESSNWSIDSNEATPTPLGTPELTLTQITSVAMLETVLASWSAVPGATAYRLQTRLKGQTNITDKLRVEDGTSRGIGASWSVGQTWEVQVRAINESAVDADGTVGTVLGDWSPWSEITVAPKVESHAPNRPRGQDKDEIDSDSYDSDYDSISIRLRAPLAEQGSFGRAERMEYRYRETGAATWSAWETYPTGLTPQGTSTLVDAYQQGDAAVNRQIYGLNKGGLDPDTSYDFEFRSANSLGNSATPDRSITFRTEGLKPVGEGAYWGQTARTPHPSAPENDLPRFLRPESTLERVGPPVSFPSAPTFIGAWASGTTYDDNLPADAIGEDASHFIGDLARIEDQLLWDAPPSQAAVTVDGVNGVIWGQDDVALTQGAATGPYFGFTGSLSDDLTDTAGTRISGIEIHPLDSSNTGARGKAIIRLGPGNRDFKSAIETQLFLALRFEADGSQFVFSFNDPADPYLSSTVMPAAVAAKLTAGALVSARMGRRDQRANGDPLLAKTPGDSVYIECESDHTATAHGVGVSRGVLFGPQSANWRFAHWNISRGSRPSDLTNYWFETSRRFTFIPTWFNEIVSNAVRTSQTWSTGTADPSAQTSKWYLQTGDSPALWFRNDTTWEKLLDSVSHGTDIPTANAGDVYIQTPANIVWRFVRTGRLSYGAWVKVTDPRSLFSTDAGIRVVANEKYATVRTTDALDGYLDDDTVEQVLQLSARDVSAGVLGGIHWAKARAPAGSSLISALPLTAIGQAFEFTRVAQSGSTVTIEARPKTTDPASNTPATRDTMRRFFERRYSAQVGDWRSLFADAATSNDVPANNVWRWTFTAVPANTVSAGETFTLLNSVFIRYEVGDSTLAINHVYWQSRDWTTPTLYRLPPSAAPEIVATSAFYRDSDPSAIGRNWEFALAANARGGVAPLTYQWFIVVDQADITNPTDTVEVVVGSGTGSAVTIRVGNPTRQGGFRVRLEVLDSGRPRATASTTITPTLRS